MEMLKSYLLPQLAFMAPVALTYLVGIVLALVYLNRLGRPAWLALIGCVILLLVAVTAPFVNGYLMAALRSGAIELVAMTWRMSVFNIIRMLLDIVGFALVLAAVFTRRAPPAGVQQ